MSRQGAINPYYEEVKSQIYRAVLIIAISAFWIVALINLINQRPIVNAILPIAAGLVVFGMYMLSKKERFKKPVKWTFLILLCVLYLPAAWITSPGSFSAMSFFAVLIVFIGIILVQANWEYVFPFVSFVEVIALLFYEIGHPEQYRLYSTLTARAFDLSINFTVVAIVLFVTISIMNRFFNDEHHRLFNVSITDQLTQLYNRSYLMNCLEDIQFQSRRDQVPYAILMMDLNHFKQVNDKYGHGVGDEVLIEFGKILKEASRRYDVPVRYGGDEFILVLSSTDRKQAHVVEERIHKMFEPLSVRFSDVKLSVSIGIAENEGLAIQEIIKMADDHLYKKKKAMKKDAVTDIE